MRNQELKPEALRQPLQKSLSIYQEMLRPYWVPTLLSLAVAGLLVRLVVALVTHGSNDVDTWKLWASLLEQHSFSWMYDNREGFNHPPLISLWALEMFRLSRATGIRFAILIKIASLIADGVATYLLWRIWRPAGTLKAALAAVLFAWNLDSILVSGFHGNTDPLCAMLCLGAAALLDRRSFFAGGLTLAASLNVKLIPLLIVPALFLYARTRREAMLFIAGLALGCLSFVPILITAGSGFYSRVVGYNSSPDNWGIGYFLNAGAVNPRYAAVAARLAPFYRTYARYLIVGLCVLLALWGRRRGWSAYRTSFLCLATFLVLAPGFGVQYTVYVVPLLFALNLRRAVTYAWASGLFILSVYFYYGHGTSLFWSDFTYPPAEPQCLHPGGFAPPSSLFGLVTWLVLFVVASRELSPPVALDAPHRADPR